MKTTQPKYFWSKKKDDLLAYDTGFRNINSQNINTKCIELYIYIGNLNYTKIYQSKSKQ